MIFGLWNTLSISENDNKPNIKTHQVNIVQLVHTVLLSNLK